MITGEISSNDGVSPPSAMSTKRSQFQKRHNRTSFFYVVNTISFFIVTRDEKMNFCILIFQAILFYTIIGQRLDGGEFPEAIFLTDQDNADGLVAACGTSSLLME